MRKQWRKVCRALATEIWNLKEEVGFYFEGRKNSGKC
jgi:hypothetical protein